jgi:hypothetical protein
MGRRGPEWPLGITGPEKGNTAGQKVEKMLAPKASQRFSFTPRRNTGMSFLRISLVWACPWHGNILLFLSPVLEELHLSWSMVPTDQSEPTLPFRLPYL